MFTLTLNFLGVLIAWSKTLASFLIFYLSNCRLLWSSLAPSKQSWLKFSLCSWRQEISRQTDRKYGAELHTSGFGFMKYILAPAVVFELCPWKLKITSWTLYPCPPWPILCRSYRTATLKKGDFFFFFWYCTKGSSFNVWHEAVIICGGLLVTVEYAASCRTHPHFADL